MATKVQIFSFSTKQMTQNRSNGMIGAGEPGRNGSVCGGVDRVENTQPDAFLRPCQSVTENAI
jgi:hypothetical protein